MLTCSLIFLHLLSSSHYSSTLLMISLHSQKARVNSSSYLTCKYVVLSMCRDYCKCFTHMYNLLMWALLLPQFYREGNQEINNLSEVIKLLSVRVRTRSHSSLSPGSGHTLSGFTDNTTALTLPLNQCQPSPASTCTINSQMLTPSESHF